MTLDYREWALRKNRCIWVADIWCMKESEPDDLREDVKIPTYKPHRNHKRSSVSSHTLAPTSICDLSHSLCWRPLTDLGHLRLSSFVVCLWSQKGNFDVSPKKGAVAQPTFRPLKHAYCIRLMQWTWTIENGLWGWIIYFGSRHLTVEYERTCWTKEGAVEQPTFRSHAPDSTRLMQRT